MIEIVDAKPEACADCDLRPPWYPPLGGSRRLGFRVASGGEIAAHTSNAAERINEP
jgi:hypothetical protein